MASLPLVSLTVAMTVTNAIRATTIIIVMISTRGVTVPLMVIESGILSAYYHSLLGAY